MLNELTKLQKKILDYEIRRDSEYDENAEYQVTYSSTLSFFPVGEYFDITFYGVGHDDNPSEKATDTNDEGLNFAFCGLLDLLGEQKNADKLLSITFTGSDEGANGSRRWDFSRLINSGVTFPKLQSFKVALTDPGDHNQSIIDGDCLEEDGMIAKLVSKMPVLDMLVVPSAPNKSFFEIGDHPLRYLRLQAGYSNEGFIENLANSNNFKNLQRLDFTEIDLESSATEDYTSFDNYKSLFQSRAFSGIGKFTLRHSQLTKEQLFELQKMKDVQFLYISACTIQYVKHLMEKEK